MKTAGTTLRTRYNLHMADLVYVGVIVAFFALAALFVRGCDRIVGPDEAEK